LELKRITFKASDELNKLLNKHTEKRGDKNKSELIRELLEKGFRNKAIENNLDLINRKNDPIMDDQKFLKRNVARVNLAINILLEYIAENDKAYESYLYSVKKKVEAILKPREE
jgi:hypothetical protein